MGSNFNTNSIKTIKREARAANWQLATGRVTRAPYWAQVAPHQDSGRRGEEGEGTGEMIAGGIGATL